MNTRSLASLALVCAAAAASLPTASAATAPAASLPSDVAAMVNHVPIPKHRLDEAVKATGQADTPVLRERLKRRMVVGLLVEQAAERGGYDMRPEVLAVAAHARAQAAVSLYLREHARPERVTAEQVKASYRELVANTGQFEYRPLVIAVSDAAQMQAAQAELSAGADFFAVAQKYNTVANGGVTTPMWLKTPLVEGHTDGLPLVLAQQIVSMDSGAVSAPIALDNAYAIVRLDDKQPAVMPSFEQAAPVLRRQLEAKAQKRASIALIEQLASQATIER
ncbi:peptidylprolyl isomerase [Burkholderia sp. Ac-20379]|uniref:peptidylprolyl isomerase n=1 Tax=Burkholderia sp. Ac-20379 TaxID=2703900 RepID=UPI00197F7AE9|nr:peptidylprolyl isomerase [Burkholderia sp. Ac-20379]MBN3727035.1 peptidyl-prolyl cis-trans isomerase [Burkholderia sp. Ac-20379]